MADERIPWKKVLYEKQCYPDNYLDEEQFKKDLKKNLHTKVYDMKEAMKASLIVSQEMNSVFLFVMLIWLMEQDVISSIRLLIITLILPLLLVIAWSIDISSHYNLFMQLFEWVKQCLLFMVFLSGFSPILKTLTESTSTDTIWFLTILMFIVHLLFHNYGYHGVLTSESFSLNAAVFSAVCLASRLPTSFHVFTAVVIAVVLFNLVPQTRNHLQGSNSYYFIHFMHHSSLLVNLTILLLYMSYKILLFHLITSATILLICPSLYVRLQSYKKAFTMMLGFPFHRHWVSLTTSVVSMCSCDLWPYKHHTLYIVY